MTETVNISIVFRGQVKMQTNIRLRNPLESVLPFRIWQKDQEIKIGTKVTNAVTSC